VEKIKTDDALILLQELVDWNSSAKVQSWMATCAQRFPFPEEESKKAGYMWARARDFLETQKDLPATLDSDTEQILTSIRAHLSNIDLDYKIDFRKKKAGYYVLLSASGTVLESGNPGDIRRYIEDCLRYQGRENKLGGL